MKIATFVLLGVAGLASAACYNNNNNNDESATPTTPSHADTSEATAPTSTFAFLNGTWVGEWIDTRFDLRGTLEATFTVNGSAISSTGTIGLQSLGLGNEEGIGTGTISGNGLSFTFEARTVGNGNGALQGGHGSGTGTVLGVLNFGDFSFEGTVNQTTIDGTFAFTDPAGGRGTARLTKQ